MAKKGVRIFDVYWSPTGEKIATVEASTAKIAKSKAPMPYRRYKGEMYVEDRGEKSGPGPNLYDRVPNGRLVPARIRHKGKTYAGKVKKVNGRVKIFVTPQVARKINPQGFGNYQSTQIDTSKDFHTLSSREVEAVLAEADRQKYRKPKSASGSRARYFFQKLQREAARSKR